VAAHAAAATRVTGFESLLASTSQSTAREATSAPPSPLDWGLALGISTADFAARAFTCDAASLKNIRGFIALAAGSGGKAWVGMARTGDTVVCAVADPSPAPPTRPATTQLADSGRGLLIVDALSDKWGYATSEPSGKTVWARVSLTSPQRQ
jgi:hypothetical protein